MKAHAKSHTHCQVARKAPHEPKLVNKYVFTAAPKEMKIVANLKDKMIENMKCQVVTKAIRNLGNVLILKFVALNIFSGKLKVNRFKIPNYA